MDDNKEKIIDALNQVPEEYLVPVEEIASALTISNNSMTEFLASGRELSEKDLKRMFNINMCRYCGIVPKYDDDWDNYWDNEIDIAETSGWTGLRMGVLRDGKIYIAATGDDRTFYYPKYCPECGRKL